EVGDVIAKDDNIVLLESDKASVEVPSSAAGKVTKISVAIGDQVSEGMVLIELESADDSAESNDENAAEEQEANSTDDVKPESKPEPVATESKQSESAAKPAANAGKATTHALPDLGVDEAQVSEIMVSVGDTVSAEQSILLIESDKASVEVPAPVAGKIEKILVEAGDMVANGQDFIVIMESSTDDASDSESEAPKPQESAPAKTEDKPAAKTTGEPKQAAKPTNTDTAASKTEGKLTEAQVNEKLVDVYAGPAVRKLARQLGVDITQVNGSALNDRILKEDLFAHVKNSLTKQKAAPVSSNPVSSGLPKLPDMSNAEIWGETETQDLSRLQKVSIPQLNYNTLLPQVTQFDLS
ncbi:biotin/lipoyl-containing protein, partial [Psychrobacter sp. NPDC078370]